ncbi:MAG: HAD family hydrolase [Ruegeria sp.]|uniref:HAD family hydrolase n=1 Tax=Ruegeria sp. TaxID=1879320 RepID=UPI00349E8E28
MKAELYLARAVQSSRDGFDVAKNVRLRTAMRGFPPILDFNFMAGIEAVCFDAFGTLMEIAAPERTWSQLLKIAPPHARKPLKWRVLRECRDISDWPKALGFPAGQLEITEIERRIHSEAQSIRTRPGMDRAWKELRERGFRLGICSNLASPYGAATLAALPDEPDATVFSYELGRAKPDPEIYAAVANELRVLPREILFVGDTKSADIDGPVRAGMRAMFVAEFESQLRKLRQTGPSPP